MKQVRCEQVNKVEATTKCFCNFRQCRCKHSFSAHIGLFAFQVPHFSRLYFCCKFLYNILYSTSGPILPVPSQPCVRLVHTWSGDFMCKSELIETAVFAARRLRKSLVYSLLYHCTSWLPGQDASFLTQGGFTLSGYIQLHKRNQPRIWAENP